MKVYFMFRPCKSDRTFEMIPEGDINRKLLINVICETLNGKILNDNDSLTLIDFPGGKISVSKNNKILIKEINKEDQARVIANRIMSRLLRG